MARKTGPPKRLMNLNWLLRRDVLHVAASLGDADVSLGETDPRDRIDCVADRISDESQLRRKKQFPYEYFALVLNADANASRKYKTEPHTAAETRPPGMIDLNSDLSILHV